MSINNLQEIIKNAEREETPEWYDLSDYEGYDYTLKNGRVFLIRPWEKESDISKLTSPKKIQKPKEPFCYKSIKDFKERKSNKLPNKIWNVKNNFFSGKKSFRETKDIIEEDKDLREYFKTTGRAKLKEFFYPDDSFLDYLSKQENSSEFNVFNLRNTLYSTAKEVSKNIGTPVQVIATLLYDDVLRKTLVGKTPLKEQLKKNKLEAISKASNISKNEIKEWTKKVKTHYEKEIFDYKKRNNLLNYSDFKKADREEIFEKIREEAENKNYSEIAKKYGLKNSKVVSRIMREKYDYSEKDLYEKIEFKKQPRTGNTIKESIEESIKEISNWPDWKKSFIGIENDNTFNEEARKCVGIV